MTEKFYWHGIADLKLCAYFPFLFNFKGRITYNVNVDTDTVLSTECHIRHTDTSDWMPVDSNNVTFRSIYNN